MNDEIREKIDKFFNTHPKHSVPKKSLITLAGEEPKHVTYLLDGVVEQYHITPQGNKVVVNIFKPPAFFPMSWAINKTPNLYFYETLTNATLIHASPNEVVAFLKTNSDVTYDLLSRVYKGTDALLRRIILAASGVAVNRIIFELLIEAYRFGKDIDDDHIEVHIKQSDLATRSGLARETVSRELHKLSEKKYVAFTKNGFLLSTSALEDLLDISV